MTGFGSSAADPAPAAKPEKKTRKTARLSSAQVVQRHIAARGGAAAWGAVQALALRGKIEAGSGDSLARSLAISRAAKGRKARRAAKDDVKAPRASTEQIQLPFRLTWQRPNKSRLEIDFAGSTAVQVYDGQSGWKVRPYLNRKDVEPFTAAEAKVEAETAEFGDPLVDAAAKGTKVELDGVEKVEGSDAYKLKLTKKSGAVQHIWIDAKSFLDVKVEGVARHMDGKEHAVYVFQRDFRTVEGVKLPFTLETVVDGYPERHKTTFEKADLNPRIDAGVFAKPKAG